jgi:hypothetical protein
MKLKTNIPRGGSDLVISEKEEMGGISVTSKWLLSEK